MDWQQAARGTRQRNLLFGLRTAPSISKSAAASGGTRVSCHATRLSSPSVAARLTADELGWPTSLDLGRV